MIGNVYRGDGPRGLLNYLAGKEGALLLSTNLDGSTPQAFARQIGQIRQLHPKKTLAQPVCHIPLRPSPGEDLTNEQWEEVLDLTLERMGYANSPYVAYIHDHGDGRHLHIATYRVTFEGRLVSDSNDRYKVMEVAREVEQAFGLKVAKPQRSMRLTRPALERLLRDPDRATVVEALRRTIDQAAAKHDTLRGFLTELHRLGVPVSLKVARKSGALQGISFRLPDGATVKGSDLGKRYSLANICNRHELRTDGKAEGPILIAAEVTQREYDQLQREGLTPDLALRYGNRRSLFWQLPPDHERDFTDLLAARLPHRFLSYADEFPAAVPRPDLDQRARQVRLFLEIVEEGPSLAPDLPRVILAEPSAPATPQGLAEAGQRCQELSAQLVAGGQLSAVESAALRADYHGAMTAALAAASTDLSSVLRSPQGAADRAAAYSWEAKLQPAEERGVQEQKLQPAEVLLLSPPDSRRAEVSPFERSSPLIEQQLQVAERGAALESSLSPLALLASAYERSGSAEAFREWARAAQTERRSELHPRADAAVPQLQAALTVLGSDLLQAQDRYIAEPTDRNQESWRRRQAAYESLAQRLEGLPRGHDRAPDGSHTAPASGIDTLRENLLHRQDVYLSHPTPATELAWREARQLYSSAVPSPVLSRVPDVGFLPFETLERERSALRTDRHHLMAAEVRFLAAPTDSEARAAWVEATHKLAATKERLNGAGERALTALAGAARQSASTLAFYEEAYFRGPSPVTERLWRQAERGHLRASLAYEKARLASERVPESAPSKTPPRTRALGDASRTVGRIFEKHLLGRPLQADALARRAAEQAWARTSIGRALLHAAHPLRSLVSALPSGAVALSAAGTTLDLTRRSLAIYADLRAASDRLRSRSLPREFRRLEQGDFSSRSLATAVVRARITEVMPSPRTLPDAIQISRSAEAHLLVTYRGFRRGFSSKEDLGKAAARALGARAAVTEQIHVSLGLPAFRDFTAVLGTDRGRAVHAWIRTLQHAGLSARAIAGSLAETTVLTAASASAAVLVVATRQLVRAALRFFSTQAREIVRE